MKFFVFLNIFVCNFALAREILPFPEEDRQYLNMQASSYSNAVGCVKKGDITLYRFNHLAVREEKGTKSVCKKYCRPYRSGETVKAVCHCGSEKVLGFGKNISEAQAEATAICNYMQNQNETLKLTCSSTHSVACFRVYHNNSGFADSISQDMN